MSSRQQLALATRAGAVRHTMYMHACMPASQPPLHQEAGAAAAGAAPHPGCKHTGRLQGNACTTACVAAAAAQVCECCCSPPLLVGRRCYFADIIDDSLSHVSVCVPLALPPVTAPHLSRCAGSGTVGAAPQHTCCMFLLRQQPSARQLGCLFVLTPPLLPPPCPPLPQHVHTAHANQMADFYHRTEVRDITGHCNSLLFNPDDFPDFRRLKKGSTCFVRYASKAYFSDLMTQVCTQQTHTHTASTDASHAYVAHVSTHVPAWGAGTSTCCCRARGHAFWWLVHD